MNNTILQAGQCSISKEQLRQLTDPKVKEWFPEAFEVKLEVGKWFKRIWKDGNRDIDLFLISDLIENIFITGEFFRNNERLEEGVGYRFKNEKDESEGYIYKEGRLYLYGWVIFEKGNWATIIPTITKSEAEKLLNKKIID